MLVTIELTWPSLVSWQLKVTPNKRAEETVSTWAPSSKNFQFWLFMAHVKSTMISCVRLAFNFILMTSASIGASYRILDLMVLLLLSSIAAAVASSTKPKTFKLDVDMLCKRWRKGTNAKTKVNSSSQFRHFWTKPFSWGGKLTWFFHRWYSWKYAIKNCPTANIWPSISFCPQGVKIRPMVSWQKLIYFDPSIEICNKKCLPISQHVTFSNPLPPGGLTHWKSLAMEPLI